MKILISVSAARRFSIKEGRQLVQQAIEKDKRSLKELKPIMDNPSVSPMYYRKEGSLEAYQSVLDMFNGNLMMIRIAAK